MHPQLNLSIASQAPTNLIKCRFRDHSGYDVIERGQFHLSLRKVDLERQELYESNSDTWLPLIEPGVTMLSSSTRRMENPKI